MTADPQENNVSLFPPWKELVKVALTWEYGSFHSHEEISSIIGVDAQSTRYYPVISKARQQLIEHGMLLETLTDRGYFVTEINRYNEATFEDIKRSKKFLELSILKSKYAPVEKMDEQTRKRHDIFLVKQVGLLNMSLPFYTEITKIAAPVPSRFLIKERKPKEANNDNL